MNLAINLKWSKGESQATLFQTQFQLRRNKRMVSFSQKMLLLSLIISSMCMMSNAVRRRHVNITNKIGKNISVRCRSKNDDLHEHLLRNDQTYSFSFKNNIFRTTLFFCRFTWDDKLHCFNIYDAHRDACTNQSLFTDGPCLAETPKNKTTCFIYHQYLSLFFCLTGIALLAVNVVCICSHLCSSNKSS